MVPWPDIFQSLPCQRPGTPVLFRMKARRDTVIEVKPGQGTAIRLRRGGVIEKIVGFFECGPHIVITRVQPIFRHVVV